MASSLTPFGLHTAATPERQQAPLKSALKFSTSPHPFYRRNTSPELPQDSNTDALDDNDVLGSSMAADSAIACTPPLSATDSTDEVDDLFSPFSPVTPLRSYYHINPQYPHATIPSPSLAVPSPHQHTNNHPFHPLDQDIVLPLPDKSQVAKRLQLAGSKLTPPIFIGSTTPPLLQEEREKGRARRRPTVCFNLEQEDDASEQSLLEPVQEAQTSLPSSPPYSPTLGTVTHEASAAVSSLPFLPGHEQPKEETNEEKEHKGVDALEHDLSTLHLESNTKPTVAPNKATSNNNNSSKTDNLLGHILVEQAPTDMLVALFDRPSEMQALAARNSDFFRAMYVQVGSASLATFKQLLFSSREDKCDLVWMHELSSYLKAQPCLLEKFKGLVGWVGPDDSENSDDDERWGEDQYGYRDSSYEQVQIKWIRDFPEQQAALRDEYPQFFVNAREQLQGKRLSFGGDRRDLYEIFCETLFLTREQLRCDDAWMRRMNACLEKHPDLLLQLKEIVAYEVGWDD